MKKLSELFTTDKVLFAALLSTLILFIIFILYINIGIRLNGEKNITLNYKEEYIEEGANANFFGNHNDKITIDGEVDSTKLGDYLITYKYKLGPFTFKTKRSVKVVDKEAPVITLVGEKDNNSCPTTNYIEEGYTATDNYDGDLTSQVERTEEENKIIYTVKDSNDNVTTVERTISLIDEKQPTLELVGGTSITATKGYKYQERGYKVSDNCDKDLKVKVTGNVDTSKLGTYTLTYEVTDNSGNTTKVERTVKVVEYSAPVVDTTPGVIFLTFDDGPSGSGSTEKILNILKQEDVKATFFVTGSGPDSLIIREHNEGHVVALHTYTHSYKDIYISEEAYFADLDKVHDRVQKLTGVDARVIRFPGGSNNTVSNSVNKGIMSILRQDVKDKGYNYFDWNVDANDAGKCAAKGVADRKKCVYDNVTKGLSKKRRNIVLMHDIKSYTADALEDIIKYAKANNYSFEVLTYETSPIRFS